MRLHTLDIQAFGPFGGATSVDFDALSETGLFLFTGKTGSGKTSVLDAVCFALYGSVPGSRQVARQLRSDHADPDVPPEVTLEFSVGERRFRVRRSPAWQRPKRRGTGMTSQQASVLLEESVNADWHPLTTRIDDAGDQITHLLGMQASQFTQVAMLPQGEFQKFLGARTDDRQAILQRLFNTDRFTQIERWIRDRATELRRSVEAHTSAVHDALNRMEEVSGTATPAEWDDIPIPLRLSQDLPRVWCREVIRAVRADVEGATAESRSARSALAVCVDQHATAVDTARLQTEGRAARAELDQGVANETHLRQLEEQLSAHQRAQPAHSVGRQVDVARDRLDDLDTQTVAALASAGQSTDLSTTRLETLREASQRTLHAVTSFQPRAREWEVAERRLLELRAALAPATSRLDELAAQARDLPAQRAELEERVVEARLAAARLPALAQTLDQAREAHAGAVRLVDVCARADIVAAEVRVATDRHQSLRERHQDLREQRIEAMAGELAAGLAAGCSCPVCGSSSHPSPAVLHAAVSKDDEDAARALVDDAAIALEAVRDHARSLAHELTTLSDLVGDDGVDVWAQRVDEARAAHDAAADLALSLDTLQQDAAGLGRRIAAIAQERADATETLAGIETEARALEENIERFRSEERTLLQDTGFATLAEALEGLGAETEALDRALTSMRARDNATEALRELEATLAREASRAGFADVAEALGAILEPAVAQERQARLDATASALAAARATLGRDDVQAALAAAVPDLPALERALQQASSRADTARARQQMVEARFSRLAELAGRLEAAMAAATPVVDQHHVISELADLLEGRSADHEVRMRLSAYVLSERLRAVVDAANDQLSRMGLDRFTLETSDTGTGRDRRGGLGLRVRDTWTSSIRETGTLSGGESFMVALALALGLADTVTAESGGVQIETLFVDEGFGSLDSDALEGVMDTLDALREGGRAVGVVSHVAEMRERIPTQVKVTARPHGGSSLRILLGA